MASHHIDGGRASALPLHLLAQAIPMLTRNELASLTERLIDVLDTLDGDPDTEPDDEDSAVDDRGCDVVDEGNDEPDYRDAPRHLSEADQLPVITESRSGHNSAWRH